MLFWADVIFVMERRHKQLLNERFPLALVNKEIVVLEIEDDYQFGDAELLELLKDSLKGYL